MKRHHIILFVLRSHLHSVFFPLHSISVVLMFTFSMLFPSHCPVSVFAGRSCTPQTAGIGLRGESLSCCRQNSCNCTAEWRWRLLPVPPPVHHKGAELTHTLMPTPGQDQSSLFSFYCDSWLLYVYMLRAFHPFYYYVLDALRCKTIHYYSM